MRERERLKERRAIDSVISALILSAVVLAVGGAIWAFSQGAMTISAEDYAESVIETTDTISERFIVEHVAYVGSDLKVWIFNYGKVGIGVKIQVGSVNHPQDWIEIAAGGFAEVTPLSYTAESGDELVIRAFTERGNSAYYRYLVP